VSGLAHDHNFAVGDLRRHHPDERLMNALRKKPAGKALKGVERQQALARHDLLQGRMRDTLRQIIPYERPKLAAIEVSGDQINPTRVKPDLTKLTDEELNQLEKIVLKVGTGASGGAGESRVTPDGDADQASSSHRPRRA